MSSLENTRWEDSSYSTLSLPTRDDCKHACLDDCNCEAAVFEDGNCKKRRLPLRFGRRSLSDSNILFVKEGVDPKKKGLKRESIRKKKGGRQNSRERKKKQEKSGERGEKERGEERRRGEDPGRRRKKKEKKKKERKKKQRGKDN